MNLFLTGEITVKKEHHCLLILFLSGMLWADFNPPEWRDSPGSTYQKWTFSTDSTSSIADSYNNLNGTPSMGNIADGRWLAQVGSQLGVWEAKSMNFYIPNDTTKPETTYRIEMVWDVQASGYPALHVYVGSGADTASAIEATIIENSLIPNSWRWQYTIFEITAPTCTSTPAIFFKAEFTDFSRITPIYVDEVVIDTISVPEPATLLFIGLGSLLIRRKVKL
jgi:hypothetical protein